MAYRSIVQNCRDLHDGQGGAPEKGKSGGARSIELGAVVTSSQASADKAAAAFGARIGYDSPDKLFADPPSTLSLCL